MRSRRLPPAARPPRRGAILLVVLAMLALFAVLGLSFVLYAESSATAARINREAMDLNSSGGALTATIGGQEFAEAAGKAIGQMLFDAADTDPTGATSGLRGYGLVRLKYGYDRNAYLTTPPVPVSNFGMTPFVGAGLITDAEQNVMPSGATTPPGQLNLNGGVSVFRSQVVNYAYQPAAPGNSSIIDPEWTGYRDNPTSTTLATGVTQTYKNIAAGYTFPDLKDLPLAVVSAINHTDPNHVTTYDIGSVLQPSYHRYGPSGKNAAAEWPLSSTANVPAWVFNGTRQVSPASGSTLPTLAVAGSTTFKQENPLMRLAPPASVSPNSNNGQGTADDDWLNVAGRFKILRPRPVDHALPGDNPNSPVFPYVPKNADGTYTGDVQNLPSSGMQRNDSLWIYPAGPIVTVNNKKYTALIAPLVLDLGGRVNLSTAGNLLKNSQPTQGSSARRRTGDDHASSLGIGRWEVNPRWVFEPNATFRNPNGLAGILNASTHENAALNFKPGTSPETQPHNQLALRNLLTGVNGSGGTTQFTQVDGTAVSVYGRYGLQPWTVPAVPLSAMPSAAEILGGATPPTDPIVGAMTTNTSTPPAQAYASFNGSLTNTGTPDPAFNPTQTLRTPPHYSLVDFDAIKSTALTDVAQPVGQQYTPFPTFSTNRYYHDAASQQFEFNNHPAQFSPSFYPSVVDAANNVGTAGRTFAAADMRWLATRITGRPDEYSNADVAKLLAQELIAGGLVFAPTVNGPQATPRYDATKPPTAPQTFTATGVPNGTYNPNPYGRTAATDPTPPAPGTTTTDPLGLSRTDPAILTRMLVTTISNSTSRPELTLPAITKVDSMQQAAATGTARLGPIDLARPLPDYRYNPTPSVPLTGADWTPDKVRNAVSVDANQTAQVQAAQAARQRMARDIFIRLVVLYSKWRVATGQPAFTTNNGNFRELIDDPATSTNGIVDGTGNAYGVAYVADPIADDFGYLRINSVVQTENGATNPPERFNTLRQLAQLAVNVVDYLDPDDVSTTFIWNPPPGTGGAAGDPMANYTSGTLGFNHSDVSKYVVFGTELPRLVVNEAYAAVKNKDTDTAGTAATQAATRFFVELHNPLTVADQNLSQNGSARLFYLNGSSTGAMNQKEPITPYQIQITESTGVAANLALPGNVTGLPSPTGLLNATPVPTHVQIGTKLANDYAGSSPLLTGADEPYLVKPLVPPAGPSGTPQSNTGYYLLGPTEPLDSTSSLKASLQMNDHPTARATVTGTTITPANRGTNDSVTGLPLPPAGMKVIYNNANENTLDAADGKTYAVLLRRLANPYLPEQSNTNSAYYNPYVTVDVFDGLAVDRQAISNDDGGAPYTHNGVAPSTPIATKGRQHPFAAAVATLLNQTGGISNPKNTFYSSNSNQNNPLRWLTHLDRQPLNPIEIASVSAVPPSLLTTTFATGTATPFRYNQHTAERLLLPIPDQGGNGGGLTSFGSGTTTVMIDTVITPNNQGLLHQAFDYLAVRSPVSTSAVGAPEAGRINLNAVNHPALLRALFDPNTAATDTANTTNLFEEQDVDTSLLPPQPPGFVPGFWQKLSGGAGVSVARSPSFPNLAQTPGTIDNPLRALSAPWPTPPFTTTTVEQLQQTTLRRHDGVATSPSLFMHPFQNPALGLGQEVKDHVVLKTEPMRKVWNNSSTTSDTFMVLMTVAFFEVRQQDPATGRVYLGKELSKDTPGDMRQKYAAVIDRSHAAVEVTPGLGTATRTGKQDGAAPWYTVTTTDVVQGVYDTTGVPAAGPYVNNAPGPNTGKPVTCTIEAKQSSLPTVNSLNQAQPPTPTGVVFLEGQQIHIVQDLTKARNDLEIEPTAAASNQHTSVVRLGFGDAAINNGEGELFSVGGVTPDPNFPGRVTLNLLPFGLFTPSGLTTTTTAVYRYHPAGSVVTNVVLGNPGPQPAFVPTDARYKYLVRYFGKMNQ